MNSDEIKLATKPEDKDKSVSFEIGYIVPFWSSKPKTSHNYSLDVWREGVITDNIDISKKEYYLVGRNSSTCDIISNNMTISRIHCVIQHKDDGDVYLYDLDSVYGTFINKRPIAKKTYVKLNVGDTFKAGQSNKMFILNGPVKDVVVNETTSKLNVMQDLNINNSTQAGGNVIIPPMQLIDKKELLEKRKNMVQQLYDQRENYKKSVMGEINEVVWGQRDHDEDIMQHQREEEEMYANERNQGDDDLEGALNLEELKERKDLTEKQRSMITKLETMMTGVRKLKEEITKLKKKEMDNGELTEGQKKRIEYSEKKLTESYEKYEQGENNLKISLASKEENEGNQEQKFDRKLAKELDSEDEYFNRAVIKNNLSGKTNNTDNKIQQGQVITLTENYESLKQKLENAIKSRQRMLDKLQNIGKVNNMTDEIDSLDLYFLETQNQLNSAQKTILTDQINEMTKDITKTQKLLSLVTPSHIKIKYKNDEEKFQPQQRLPMPVVDPTGKKKKLELVVDTVNRLNKMSRKIMQENTKKITDSDEEMMGEAENYKDKLGKEVEMDENFKRKIEEFKKSLNNQKSNIHNEEQDKGGLIINSNGSNNLNDRKKINTAVKIDNVFDDIINNISNPNFDISNYKMINSAMYSKTEDKSSLYKRNESEIDFSKGGLQTFDGDDFSGRKRGREEPKKFGVTSKPANRNEDEIILDDENDYDVIYTVGEKMGVEHDLNVNPYKKFSNINEDE